MSPEGAGALPGRGDLPNLLGFPGKKPPPVKTQADADDLADEAACAALPASQMGGAVNGVLAWQSPADDPRLVARLAAIVCFPPEYLLLVTAAAVGLPAPSPGAAQRPAMLGQISQTMGAVTDALAFAKDPG